MSRGRFPGGRVCGGGLALPDRVPGGWRTPPVGNGKVLRCRLGSAGVGAVLASDLSFQTEALPFGAVVSLERALAGPGMSCPRLPTSCSGFSLRRPPAGRVPRPHLAPPRNGSPF